MSPTFTALDSIRESGITIASDGAEYKSKFLLKRRERLYGYLLWIFSEIGEFAPTDATTNPSLVLAAVSNKEYSFLLDDAVHYAHSRLPNSSVEEQTQLALDYLVFYYFLSSKTVLQFPVS